MNQLFKQLMMSGLLLGCLPSFAMTVQIFTDKAHPVSVGQVGETVQVEYYNLDAINTIVTKINRTLKGQTPIQAQQQAQSMMQHYKTQLDKAAQGIRYQHQYAIKAIPTIVFNQGDYRIQGQTHLQAAIHQYQAWQKQAKQ